MFRCAVEQRDGCIQDVDIEFPFGADLRAARGWAMRRGHRRRLECPKRGKAALQAAARGQGEEVSKGRSTFKRSVNQNRPCRPNEQYQISRSHRLFRNHFLRNFRSDVVDTLSGFKDNRAACRNNCSSELCLDVVAEHHASAWDEAVAQAARLSRRYVSEPTPVAAPTLTRSARRQQVMAARHKEEQRWLQQSQEEYRHIRERRSKDRQSRQRLADDLQRLRQDCVSLLPGDPTAEVLSLSLFEKLQMSFLNRYGSEVLRSLRGAKLAAGKSARKLVPTDLAPRVRMQFVQAWLEHPSAALCPSFHGTNNRNVPSIYERGLLIPGKGNNVRVANGSAHGLGIYTAMLTHSSLSLTFAGCQGTILVCGVLDDSVELADPHVIGRLQVKAESAHIRRVGGAIVIFDECLVAPLFAVPLTLLNMNLSKRCHLRLAASRPVQKHPRSVHHPIRR